VTTIVRRGVLQVKDDDRETRDRLLHAAARLFAKRGFSKVTVRDICGEANANVSAVNYHFGDKTGLYDEVVRFAIQTMQGTTDEMRKAGEGRPPEERLQSCIRVFLARVATAQDSWLHQLMMRELSEPTPALDIIVKQVIHPRLDYIRATIAEIIGCRPDEERVGRAVMSVHAQILALVNNPISARLRLMPELPLTEARVTVMARHIARFSVAGIRAIASDH
jgi:AcrR family transcriptional regulator